MVYPQTSCTLLTIIRRCLITYEGTERKESISFVQRFFISTINFEPIQCGEPIFLERLPRSTSINGSFRNEAQVETNRASNWRDQKLDGSASHYGCISKGTRSPLVMHAPKKPPPFHLCSFETNPRRKLSSILAHSCAAVLDTAQLFPFENGIRATTSEGVVRAAQEKKQV